MAPSARDKSFFLGILARLGPFPRRGVNKGVSRAAIPLLALLLLTACAQKEDPLQKGRLTIHYWETWSGFELQAMRDIVDKFNRSQDEIYVYLLSVGEIERKLLIATAGGDPPDIAGLLSDKLPQFADKDALEPLEPHLSGMKIDREDYIDIFWELCSFNDTLYGLPTTPATMALHWNKDEFRRVGLDPDAPPKTLEELDKMVEKLATRRPNGKIDKIGFVPSIPGWWHYGWVWWFGGDWLDEEGNITANRPENVRAYEWVRSYSEKYGISALENMRYGFGNFASSDDGFFSGKISMVLQGVWLSNFIGQFAPDMDWGAEALPSSGGKLKDVTIAETNLLVIPATARHKKEAAEFLAFVQRPENLQYLALKHTKFVPLKIANDMDYSNHPNKAIEVFIRLSQSPNVHVAPRTPIWAELNKEIISAFEEISLLKKTPREALDQLQNRMDARWAEYKRTRELVKKALSKKNRKVK